MSAVTQPAAARLNATAATDTVVIALLCLLALVPLYAAYSESAFWLAAVGGVLVGTAAAIGGLLLRRGPLEVTAFMIVGYFGFGGLFAVRSEAIAGVIPTLGTLTDLALGVVFAWKQTLTLLAPVAGFEHLLVVPYLSGLAVSTLAVSFALRLRRWAWTIVPPVGLLTLSIAFSTWQGFWSAPVGGIFAVGVLGWSAWRRARSRAEAANAAELGVAVEPGAATRRLALGAALVVAVSLVAVGTAGAVSSSDRTVLREIVVPPLELHDYASPLTAFRKLVTDGREEAPPVLFTVSGLPQGASIRLATMDLYDGIVYRVSGAGGAGAGTFSRVGRIVRDAPAGDAATLNVKIETLGGVWLPDAGYLTGISFAGEREPVLTEGLHYNRSTGTAVVTTGLQAGDEYTLQVSLPKQPLPADLAAAVVDAKVTTPVPVTPEVLAGVHSQQVTATRPLREQLDEIVSFLHDGADSYFSHGLAGDPVKSPSGHSVWRLSEMFQPKQLVGDQEQYAVAAALLAAQSGLPVRVVMGFTPKEPGSGPIAITGADVTVWIEVALEGYGWVRYDPTPPETKQLQQRDQQQRQKPRPQVLQPPEPPQEPAQLPPEPPVEQQTDEKPEPEDDWLGRALWAGGISLGALTVLLGPGAVMIALKAQRRRRRRAAELAADQVSGGWLEVVDAATDAGARLPRRTTRNEDALQLHASYPELGLTRLGARADAAVFGPGDPTPAEVDAYWSDVDTARRQISGQARLRVKLRRFFAPASLFRRGRA